MKIHFRNRQAGFTAIELVLVIVILGILVALVALTYNGVQSKDRNTERQTSINALQSDLETYYAQKSMYPTLANINDAAWRAENMKDLDDNDLKDPTWNDTTPSCTVAGKPVLAAAPADNCYAYQVTAADGSACDNVTVLCAHYTLTANLEGDESYVKTSLN